MIVLWERLQRFTVVVCALAVLSLAWAATLAVHGGLAIAVWGHTVSSRDPSRPFRFGTFLLAIGASLAWYHPALQHARRWLTQRPAIVVLAVSLAVAGTAVLFGSHVIAGSDQFGYADQARLWRQGAFVQHEPLAAAAPWPDAAATFTPLGYRVAPDGTSMVPTYPPGYPMLMALASLAFGGAALFWVTPISTALLVWATWRIGRRVSTTAVAVGGALLVSVSPIVHFMANLPMSDIPASAAWALATALTLEAAPAASLTSGLAAAVAILIRPNLAPLALILLLWTMTRQTDARRMMRGGLFAIGVLPGVIVLSLWNKQMYGAAIASGYGDLSLLFDWHWLPVNLRHYASWFTESQTIIGVIAVALLLVPALRRRVLPAENHAGWSLLAITTLVVLGSYAAYQVFEKWWYLRFLLPAWPAISLATAALVLRWQRQLPGFSLMALTCLGAAQLNYARSADVFRQADGDAELRRVFQSTAAAADRDSVVLSMQHSGALRYHAGMTTLRYDLLDPGWLDRATRWLDANGHHPYLLVDVWELPRFRARLATAGAPPVVMREVFRTEGPLPRLLFDLRQPAALNNLSR